MAVTRDRSDIDDVASPLFPLQDSLGIELCPEPNALQICVENPVPIVLLDHHVSLGSGLDPGILDKNVEATRNVPSTIEKATETRAVADIQGQPNRFAPGGANFLDPCFDLLDPSRPQDDPRPGGGEGAGKMMAEAGRCAGDSDGLTIETKTIEMPTRGRKWTKEPAIPDRTASDEEEVRILSYNIWFDNQAAQMARTEYLGRVIESCDPDVLCLQEVTLPILFVLQGQAWFEKYSLCAQPSEMELQCGYFCVVMVKKKDGAYRMCIDYRQTVNKICKNSAFPLPKIADILDKLARATEMSFFDIQWGYWNCIVRVCDRELLAFNSDTKHGLL